MFDFYGSQWSCTEVCNSRYIPPGRFVNNYKPTSRFVIIYKPPRDSTPE